MADQMDLFGFAPPEGQPEWWKPRPDKEPPRPPRRPAWRRGKPVPGSDQHFTMPAQGDLRWLWHEFGPRGLFGRWFCWVARTLEWTCIDPQDRLGINQHPDNPPAKLKGLPA
jgi:hypothetical protein